MAETASYKVNDHVLPVEYEKGPDGRHSIARVDRDALEKVLSECSTAGMARQNAILKRQLVLIDAEYEKHGRRLKLPNFFQKAIYVNVQPASNPEEQHLCGLQVVLLLDRQKDGVIIRRALREWGQIQSRRAAQTEALKRQPTSLPEPEPAVNTEPHVTTGEGDPQ